MSVIRFSAIRDVLYAPSARGELHERRYDKRSGKGALGAFPRPQSDVDAPAGDEPWTLESHYTKRHLEALHHYLDTGIATEAADLPADAPIVVMVHGFLFDPAVKLQETPHHHRSDNPHGRIYHFERHDLSIETREHSTGWLTRLGFEDRDAGKNGLAVAFGWHSSPGFFGSLFSSGTNHYKRAYELAETSAWALALVLELLAQKLPGRRIHLFCHSLGSRLVVRSLYMLARPLPKLGGAAPLSAGLAAVDRVLILAGAELVLEAQLLLAAWRDAHGPDIPARFYNFASRENDVLDVLAENFGPSSAGSKQAIGHNGLEQIDDAWLDIRLDDPDTADFFRRTFAHIDGAAFEDGRELRLIGDRKGLLAVADHWIHFTWPDNMWLYRQILRGAPQVAHDALKREPLFERRISRSGAD